MKIYLKDSLNMLSGSLDQIAKDFNIKDLKKLDFPYLFVNKNNLNYIGPTPDIKYFKNQNEYKKVSDWNMEKQTRIYLKNDILLLQKIIIEFATFIGNKVSIDITKHLTIASLAYKVYFSIYYNKLYNLKIIKKN
jgi:hypothetical protein